VSADDDVVHIELVVADDGGNPAEQLRPPGCSPSIGLQVSSALLDARQTLAGSLSDFPDLEWQDFERGSELARRVVRSG
jgi:hypothetical protein